MNDNVILGAIAITLIICFALSPAGSCAPRPEANIHAEKMLELQVRLAEAQAKSLAATHPVEVPGKEKP